MPALVAKLCAGVVSATAMLYSQAGLAQTSDLVSKHVLRVCADPANDPMSNKEDTGYENKLARFIANKLDMSVQYTWYPMATGFIRNTLRAHKCDVVMGYAQGHDMVLNTNHYFTSAYTLVTHKDSSLAVVDTLSDPSLRDRRIGIIAGTPPATHMARQGLMTKAEGYKLTVDRRYESPPIDMLNDLKAGKTDAVILWGPLAGPLVKANYPGLKVTPLLREILPPRLHFRITMGVRPGEKVWQRKLNSLIRRNQKDINAILTEAGVPLLEDMGTRLLDTPK